MRALTATRMGFREQRRHTLLLVLLVTVPFLFISWSIAITEPLPHQISLPGGDILMTTMKDLHGAIMVPITVGFLAGLMGLFVVQSALESDRRLVVAGFRPYEIILPRLIVLGAAILIVIAVSLGVTAIDFIPVSWVPFIAGNLLIGLIYGAIGALAGVFLGRLGGVYFIFFLPMMDIGVAQNPMFFDGAPQRWATVLPGYGPSRLLIDGAFSSSFHAGGDLAIGLLWLAGLSLVLALLLRRAVAAEG